MHYTWNTTPETSLRERRLLFRGEAPERGRESQREISKDSKDEKNKEKVVRERIKIIEQRIDEVIAVIPKDRKDMMVALKEYKAEFLEKTANVNKDHENLSKLLDTYEAQLPETTEESRQRELDSISTEVEDLAKEIEKSLNAIPQTKFKSGAKKEWESLIRTMNSYAKDIKNGKIKNKGEITIFMNKRRKDLAVLQNVLKKLEVSSKSQNSPSRSEDTNSQNRSPSRKESEKAVDENTAARDAKEIESLMQQTTSILKTLDASRISSERRSQWEKFVQRMLSKAEGMKAGKNGSAANMKADLEECQKAFAKLSAYASKQPLGSGKPAEKKQVERDDSKSKIQSKNPATSSARANGEQPRESVKKSEVPTYNLETAREVNTILQEIESIVRSLPANRLNATDRTNWNSLVATMRQKSAAIERGEIRNETEIQKDVERCRKNLQILSEHASPTMVPMREVWKNGYRPPERKPEKTKSKTNSNKDSDSSKAMENNQKDSPEKRESVERSQLHSNILKVGMKMEQLIIILPANAVSVEKRNVWKQRVDAIFDVVNGKNHKVPNTTVALKSFLEECEQQCKEMYKVYNEQVRDGNLEGNSNSAEGKEMPREVEKLVTQLIGAFPNLSFSHKIQNGTFGLESSVTVSLSDNNEEVLLEEISFQPGYGIRTESKFREIGELLPQSSSENVNLLKKHITKRLETFEESKRFNIESENLEAKMTQDFLSKLESMARSVLGNQIQNLNIKASFTPEKFLMEHSRGFSSVLKVTLDTGHNIEIRVFPKGNGRYEIYLDMYERNAAGEFSLPQVQSSVTSVLKAELKKFADSDYVTEHKKFTNKVRLLQDKFKDSSITARGTNTVVVELNDSTTTFFTIEKDAVYVNHSIIDSDGGLIVSGKAEKLASSNPMQAIEKYIREMKQENKGRADSNSAKKEEKSKDTASLNKLRAEKGGAVDDNKGKADNTKNETTLPEQVPSDPSEIEFSKLETNKDFMRRLMQEGFDPVNHKKDWITPVKDKNAAYYLDNASNMLYKYDFTAKTLCVLNNKNVWERCPLKDATISLPDTPDGYKEAHNAIVKGKQSLKDYVIKKMDNERLWIKMPHKDDRDMRYFYSQKTDTIYVHDSRKNETRKSERNGSFVICSLEKGIPKPTEVKPVRYPSSVVDIYQIQNSLKDAIEKKKGVNPEKLKRAQKILEEHYKKYPKDHSRNPSNKAVNNAVYFYGMGAFLGSIPLDEAIEVVNKAEEAINEEMKAISRIQHEEGMDDFLRLHLAAENFALQERIRDLKDLRKPLPDIVLGASQASFDKTVGMKKSTGLYFSFPKGSPPKDSDWKIVW